MGDTKPLLGKTDDAWAEPGPPLASNWQSAANIVKSFVGVGILGLPYALAQGGIWFGVLGFIFIAFLSNYTMKILVLTKYKYRDEGRKCETFMDIGSFACGWGGRLAVQFAQVGSQLGTCSIYIVYIAQNLHLIHDSIAVRLYILMIVPVVWALAQLRNLKYLSPTSFLGIIGVLISLGVVSYYGIDNPTPPKRFPFSYWPGAANYFGIAVFALEGILLALPLEANMKKRRDYPFVLDFCMVFVALLYIGFAMTGYLTFGDDTHSVIADNLPHSVLVLIVQICLIVELLCSYPLQLAPVLSMTEEAFLSADQKHYEIWRTLIRTGIVAISAVLAAAVPLFNLFAGLVGSMCLSVAGFVLPCLFYLVSHKGELSWWVFSLNVFCIVFGVTAGSVSSALTIKEIIYCIGHPGTKGC